MLDRRQMISASAAAWFAAQQASAAEKTSRMGLVIHSCPIRQTVSRSRNEIPPFNDPLLFLEFARQVGAGGIQVGIGQRDEGYALKLRKTAEQAGLYVEGSVALPADRNDVERFTRELNTAKTAGVAVMRTVCSNGRRYETFETAEAFDQFVKKSYERLGLAATVAAKAGLKLAVENHKDWRAEQLVELLKKIASEHVGACLDTGNNLALLDDPLATIEQLAPFACSVHFKDMAVAEYADGFLLAEVPLGTGFLDLKNFVEIIRKHQPAVRFGLEMITRDPLKIPCLTKKYWATFNSLPARELAEALAQVRRNVPKAPLPRISELPMDKQLEAEDRNIRQSLAFANAKLGFSS